MVLKILNFGVAWSYIQKGHIFQYEFLLNIWPVLAYLVLGLLPAIVLSKAYKRLPLSIVYASWMGLILVLQVFMDLFFFQREYTCTQVYFYPLHSYRYSWFEIGNSLNYNHYAFRAECYYLI